MVLVTLALAWPLGAVARRGLQWRGRVLRGFAALSIATGGWILYRAGVH
jgi:hypothetical protein